MIHIREKKNFFVQECKSSKKQLAIFPDGQHNTTWLSHDYTSQIRKFLAEVNNQI